MDTIDVARVSKSWRTQARRCPVHVVVTPKNIHALGHLCRIPNTQRVDANRFDETIIEFLRPLQALRSLEWKWIDTVAFGDLPELLANNPHLCELNGSPEAFSNPSRIVDTSRSARVCERILVTRSGASINGLVPFVCWCGDRRITTVLCHKPWCVKFQPIYSRPHSPDPHSLQDGLQIDMLALTDLCKNDEKKRSSSSSSSLPNLIKDIADRFLSRINDVAMQLAQADDTIRLQARLLEVANFQIRDNRSDMLILRGSLADAQQTIDELSLARLSIK